MYYYLAPKFFKQSCLEDFNQQKWEKKNTYCINIIFVAIFEWKMFPL